MSSTRFGFPFIAADQAQKHVAHNAALDMIDATLGGLVASATTAVAPGSPGEGDAYLLPAGVAGFGTAVAGQVAVFTGGAWIASSAFFGRRVYALDTGRAWVYGGSLFGWLLGDVAGPSTGASIGLVIREATLTMSGVSQTAAALIPAGAIVLGVSSKTTVAVTGPTSYMVGLAASGSEFGSGLGLAAGSTNVGLVGPFATYAPANVVVTRGSAVNFAGGQVRLAALMIAAAISFTI